MYEWDYYPMNFVIIIFFTCIAGPFNGMGEIEDCLVVEQ